MLATSYNNVFIQKAELLVCEKKKRKRKVESWGVQRLGALLKYDPWQRL